MRAKIRVQDCGNTYFSDELRGEGYVGDIDYLANAATVTLIKPGVSLDDVKRSLYIVLEDIDLRQRLEGKNDNGSGRRSK